MKSCPKCLGPLENYRFACKAPVCAKFGILVETEAAQATGEEQKKPQEAPCCYECGEVMSLYVCTDCGFELDDEDIRQEFLPLSLVGASGCGKSNFLSVLIDQLRGVMCKVYGCTLYPTGGDRTTAHYEREYRRPLYERGICVPSTEQEDLNPLTYTLLFPGQSNDAGKTVGLAFYDSCGGNLESRQEMGVHHRSLYHSKGILFLIDPSQFPLIKQARKAQKASVLDTDAQAMLLRTVHLIRSGLSMEDADKKINIPIAVCLTKLDILYPHLEPASFIKDQSRHLRRPMLNAADISSCNLEIMALLESWGGGELVRHVQSQFSNYCFFGLSALGSAPGSENDVDRVSPHRVLDPLLWLLWRNQALRMG